MGRYILTFLLIQLFVIKFCSSELFNEKKDKLYNGFIDYLRKLPDQPYILRDGIPQNIEETSGSSYRIEVRFNGEDAGNPNVKYVKCSGIVYDRPDSGVEVASDHQCYDDTETTTHDSLEDVISEVLTTTEDAPAELHHPIKLDNEVQTEPVTSGEQFIAVPRDRVPCIGCASTVNTQAAGVPELAQLGVTQLDELEPSARHSLNKVITVERQVQVTNGVRYILTLLVDYNNCSQNFNEDCIVTKTCKVSVLDKPWARLPDGSRYRVVIANNCTAAWLFDETPDNERDKPHDSQLPTPDYNKVPDTGSIDDIIQAVHNPDVQSQPDIEKTLTDEEIRNIEQQIISKDQFTQTSSEKPIVTNDVDDSDIHAHQVSNVESVQFSDIPSNPPNEPIKQGQITISEDKKKAIDDLITFFGFAGFDHKDDQIKPTSRLKRSYDKDLNMFNLAEKFNRMRKSIENAKHIYTLAQSMVDYLNEMDMLIKNRILNSVISAEEELENNQHFFYLQALVTIPCEKLECNSNKQLSKICNGVIDGTNEKNPLVMNTFCYNEVKKKTNIGNINDVPLDDPILLKLTNTALKTIESKSQDENALQIIRIYNANTQKVSGTLTKIAMLIGKTNCTKSKALKKRTNCYILEKLGTKLCEVEVLDKQWIKEKKVSYICTDRPVEESFVNIKRPTLSIDDPDVAEIIQEAIQYLEGQSNKNNKQKLVDVKSVSTQLIAGLLTNIEFTVGYTTCTTDVDVEVNNCEMLKNEPLRNCKTQVWHRPWLEDGRQMNVSCKIKPMNNEKPDTENDLQIRKKRSLNFVGGKSTQNVSDSKYMDLALQALHTYLQTTGTTKYHKILSIENVTTQVVSGILTRINFNISPTNCDYIGDKNTTYLNCEIENPSIVKSCHSEIWDKPWLRKTEIKVACPTDNSQSTIPTLTTENINQVSISKQANPGGQTENDNNNPRFRELAEKSLQKYLQTSGSTEPHSITTVDKVTTQVVSGTLTRIDFTVRKNDADSIKCFSKVWEQPWLNKTEIDVNCEIQNNLQRQKRQLSGGISGGFVEQDPNNNEYKELAERCLLNYLKYTQTKQHFKVNKVVKVKTQVVSGVKTRLKFLVTPTNCQINSNGQPLANNCDVQDSANLKTCDSEVWDKPWASITHYSVKCILDTDVRKKREIIQKGFRDYNHKMSYGGKVEETEKNKNDPHFRVLAEKSLQKYLQTSGSTEPHSITRIDKVSTQIVSGILTRIDFTVRKNNDDSIKCYSEVWEQPWLNKTKIDVNCEIANNLKRYIRQVPGGQTEMDKNDPHFRDLAEKSLQKYLQTSGSIEPHSITTVDKVTTQVVSGKLTRIDFTVSKNNADSIKCHTKVWEQPWLNKTEIDVNCEIANNLKRSIRQVPGGQTEKDKNDPHFRDLAEKSLQKYLQTSGSTEPHSITTVDKVTTQVVSGKLTRIDFTVSKNNADSIKCHTKVWEQPWLNKTEIDVNCEIANNLKRSIRQVPGGQIEKDKNDPHFRDLAEKSLQKYLQTSGSTEPHSITTVDKVTTQVVSGKLTRIDFTVSKNNADSIKCHTKVWEQPWLNKTEIDVNCEIANNLKRSIRQVFGGQTEKDNNDPQFRDLAEKSLQKYLQTSGSTEPHSITTVDKVTTQVVSGKLTRIDFTVSKNNADSIKCHTKVWEQPWLNKTEIDVNCEIANNLKRSIRQVFGGQTEKDKNDPQFRDLAEKSLQKYLQTSGSIEPHSITTVDKVTTQVVSGTLTRIDFTVRKNDADSIKCFSKVWEQSWLNKTEIDVNCEIAKNLKRSIRQVFGGQTEKDKNDPQYRDLAEKSLQKYLQTSGSTEPHSITTVDKVTTQVVSGTLTRIDFTVRKNDVDSIKCFSKVWEQSWLNKTEIDVNCEIAKNLKRSIRQVFGGQTEKDKNDPQFRDLAEKSLQKYLQTSGSTEPHSITTVDKVTTQVVSGTLTRIDFTVRKNDADLIKCFSKVSEQSWLNKTEIDVHCEIKNNLKRHTRQIRGGQTEKDKNDPQFRDLAEKSLQKYLQTSGSTEPHSITTVDKVTTQVVSGTLTRIDFTVRKNDADSIKCFSKVWEQPWLNKTEIDVNCEIQNNLQRQKRQLSGGISGGFVEQDPNYDEYKELAERSLLEYYKNTQTKQHFKVIKVVKVKTQVVSGVKTRLKFLVTPTNCQINSNGQPLANNCDVQDSANLKTCNSEVWDKPWASITHYSVKCILDTDVRTKREIMQKRFRDYNHKIINGNIVGSAVDQDPSKHEYKSLAEESLRKHERINKIEGYHKVLEVKRVVSQIVSGKIYKIDFTAAPTACSVKVYDASSSCEPTEENIILYCHTEIWDRPWLKRKNIDVSCIEYNRDEANEYNNIRSKRGLLGGSQSKNVNDQQYKKLAEDAITIFHENSKTKYFHKLLRINHVSEKVVQGFLINMEFSISPTTCLLESMTDNTDECPFQKPKAILYCHAEIIERTILILNEEDISVRCKRKKNVNAKKLNEQIRSQQQDVDIKYREKRQTLKDENDIDDDTKYIYADKAVHYLNERSSTDNLQKLVTIHDISSSVQMQTNLVRMYIETAYTYCLRRDNEYDLNNCDELDGTSHRLCFVKIFPSSEDELVVLRTFVVCDDEPTFRSHTGLAIPDLLTISLVFLEGANDVKFKLVHRGEPNVIPSLHSHIPVKLSFVVASTNCSKEVDVDTDNVRCFVDNLIPDKVCHSYVYMIPTTKKIIYVKANCTLPYQMRTKRSLSTHNTTIDIQNMVDQSLEKLEMSSLHRYKQRVLKINSYATKITSGRVTTIDFDVGYTNCLKYEWVQNITTCEFLEHLPRRHCVSDVWERLWLNNGRNIEVTCQDDETPLEAHVEFESAETAMRLAQQALKHIEAKYPHPKKQQVVRIFSLEKQVIAGIHYRMKIEVGFTSCVALSLQKNCRLISDGSLNRFCRVNVWIRPWTDHPPNFRVSCDYQAGASSELYHHVQAEQLFYNFITTYKPDYVHDHVEMTKRFSVFKDNIKKIHELNTHEKGTAVYAVTRFSDLTYEEFKTKYLGLNTSLKKPNQIPMRQALIPKVDQIPESFDWREHGAVTDVKNQGSCGSCWAFSVTGNVEGQWKMKTGELLSLSEQELVDCDKLDEGCNGGYMDNAYRAIEELGGLESEDEYPYEGEDDKCAFNKTMSKVQVAGAVNISSNETDMAKWLVRNGPISIGINANAMQFYVGGVSHPWKMLCDPKNIDHGVLAVGYGVKDYPLFHKRLPYWIVKNSWGAGWGEQGYYRVYRGDGTCGVNTMASSAVV